MPKSQLESLIEKATNENNTSEDWGLIMDIVDLINQSNGQRESLRVLSRRLNAKDPHISMHALTLLNACVVNCNRNFKLEVCSREFIEELRKLILNNKYAKLSEKLAYMVYEWSIDKDFKNDPALSLMTSFYNELKSKGIEFKKDDSKPTVAKVNVDLKKEEDDLAKAIQLSLKENQAKQAQLRSNGSDGIKVQQSLYGTLPQSSTTGTTVSYSEKRKIKALYDFEAAEENEITFKAGDILILLDDSDPNWWKGSNYRQEGLFPSNFVTTDLNAELEILNENGKKVTFNEEVSVKNLPPAKIVIDEGKIDECIYLIQNADPTGEIQPDAEDLLQLEDMCYCMGPLIDQELQKIDLKHAQLEELNTKLLESFQLYHSLMRESLNKQNMNYPATTMMSQPPFASINQNAQQMQPTYSQPTSTLPPGSVMQNNPQMSMPQQPFNGQQPNNGQLPFNGYQNFQQNPYPQQQQQQPQQIQGQYQYQNFPNSNSNTNLAANLNEYTTQMSSLNQVPMINTQTTTHN